MRTIFNMNREELLQLMNNRKQQCRLELIAVTTRECQILAEFDTVFEAPNWTKDGLALLINSNGRMHRFDLATRSLTPIDTDFADLCNNDHVLSPDGKTLAISHFTAETIVSKIYCLPITGGQPICITDKGPSYLHGWSPYGKRLCYTAERGGNYDIYSIALQGGVETQLTNANGLNDGPEYSPDGQKIWFNSTRSGLMQIWRMNAKDGSQPEQMTHQQQNCWFPHLSPDGQQVAYLAYRVEDLKPEEHLPDLPVQIRLMDRDGSNDRLLVELIGGQGSINVNSWSPDGRFVAFVYYGAFEI